MLRKSSIKNPSPQAGRLRRVSNHGLIQLGLGRRQQTHTLHFLLSGKYLATTSAKATAFTSPRR